MTPGTQARAGGPIRLLQRFVRRYGVARTALAGGAVTAAASALLCYAIYLALGQRLTPMALAMPIVAPLVIAPSIILLLASALSRMSGLERALDRALAASGVVPWDVDAETGEVYLDEGWSETRILAPGSQPATAREWLERVHAEERAEVLAAALKALKGQTDEYVVEYRLRDDRGDWRWLLTRGRVTERDPKTGRALRLSGTNVDITERKRSEEALRRLNEELEQRVAARTAELRAGEARLRQVIDAIPHLVFAKDRDGRYLLSNRANAEFFACDAERVIRRTPAELGLDAESAQRIAQGDERVWTSGGEIHVPEQAMTDRRGRRRVYSVARIPLSWGGSGHDAVLGVAIDVTAPKETENALREARGQLQALLDVMPNGILLQSAQRIEYANRAALRMLGLQDLQALAGRSILEFLDAAGREQAAQRIARLLREGGEVPWQEFRLARLDGSLLDFEACGVAIRERGEPRVLSVYRDITERKLAETRIRSERAFLQKILDNLPDAVYVSDLEERLILANRVYAELHGRSVADVVGLRHTDIVADPERLALVRRKDAEALASPAPIPSYELSLPSAEGEIRWLLVGKVALRDDAGRPTHVLAVAADISAQKRAEEALRDSERRLRELIDLLPIVVLVKDRHARYLLTNRLNAEILGLAPDRMMGRTSLESGWRPEDGALVDSADAAARASGVPQVIPEFAITDAAGRGRVFRNTRIPFRYSIEHPDAVLGVAVEITELKQAEARLRGMNDELERRVQDRTAALQGALRELESFSYSVSHDLRAPARAVAGFAHIVIDDYGARLPEEGRRLLARISKAGEAMGAMVDGLLELTRISRGELRRWPVDLVALAAEVWRDLAALEPGRKVELHLDAELRAEGDPVLLRNLLLNLLGNARKYTRQRADAVVWFGRTPGGEFYVRDNGVGFDTAYAAKLFGAFQRLHTEREFEGHGIGLALAKKIVERHGGTIRAEAVPGQGAAFYFTLA